MDISEKLTNELEHIQKDNLPEMSHEVAQQMITILRNIDSDLIPVLDIVDSLIANITDAHLRALTIRKLLEFYGVFGAKDILSQRQKFILKGKTLVKKPFLKNKDREYINMMIDELRLFEK